MVVMSTVMSGPDFAYRLLPLPAVTPIAAQYEAEHLPGVHWWESQKEHLIAWFSECDDAGAYDRKTRNQGAMRAYNRFQCAPGLLWLAEALGESPNVVQDAADAAGGSGRPASQCAAIRKIVPWGRLQELMTV